MPKISRKYQFSLRGINIEKLYERYGLPADLCVSSDNIPSNSTKIEFESVKDKSIPEEISFLDETKKSKKCTVSFINFENDKKKYKCFWCKQDISDDCTPIGCPVRFVPSKICRTYYSQLTKDQYTINEFVSNKKIADLREDKELVDVRSKKGGKGGKGTKKGGDKEEEKKEGRVIIVREGRYETDGIFCSFSCCMAYIEEERVHDPLYRYSEVYLHNIYNEMNGTEARRVKKAPSWKLLDCFGGNMSVKSFKEKLNRIEYSSKGMISLAYLFEDVMKIS